MLKKFRLEDIEKELGKVCNKEKMKKIYEHMMESMKKDLSESLSEFITDGINCKLKILEEVTKEGVYDAQPKWWAYQIYKTWLQILTKL